MGQNSTICHTEDTAKPGTKASDCCAQAHINNQLPKRVKGTSFIVFFLITLFATSAAFANGGCNIYTPPSNHSEQWGPNCNNDFNSWLNSCGGAKASCGSNCNDHNVTWSNNCHQQCSPCGSYTVVFTCTDNCGNSSTCSAQFNCTSGNGNLTITKQASNQTVACGSSVSSEFTTWLNNHGGATATDNGTITWSNNCKVSAPSGCGSVTVVFTASDGCGNSATTSATFTVTGAGALTITTGASGQNVACGASNCSSSFSSWLSNHGGAVATDNCSSVTWSNNCHVSAPSCCNSVTVVFTAGDACGNSATTSATFSVGGNGGNLKITKQASNETVSCGSSVSSSFTAWLNSHGGATATDNGTVTWSNNCHVSAPSGCGSVNVTFTASDACGNTATTSATFAVSGAGALTITTSASNQTVACGSSSCNSTFNSWLNNNGGAVATDNCSNVTWSSNCHVSAPSCCNSVTVVFTASDACGNTATTSATFYNGGPGGNLKITKQAQNDNVACGSSVSAEFTAWLNNHGGATATDNGTLTWSNNCHVSAPSGCGSVSVTFTVSDACGNTATTSATFSVSGTGALTITKPAGNDTVACGSNMCSSNFASWLSSHGGATATDNCSSVTWSNNCHVQAPSCCNYVTVVFTASDACGNTATTSATFYDGQGGNLKITKQAQNDNVSCGSSVSSQFTTWLNNHGGATASDNGTITWSNNCKVSAPSGCACVTVVFTATDNCGNTATTSAQFCVSGAGALNITKPAGNDTVACCTGTVTVDTCTTNFNNWCKSHGCSNVTTCENSYKNWCNNYGWGNWSPYNYSNCSNSFNSWIQNNGGNCADPCNSSTTCENSFQSWCKNYGTDGHGKQPNSFSDYCTCFNSWCSNHTTTSEPCNTPAYTAWLNNNGGAVATDNCSSVTWTNNAPSTVPSCCSSVTVIFTATDACGNTATTSGTFIVGGGGTLTITQAKNDTVTCSANINNAFNAWLTNNGGATATDAGTVTWTNNAGSNEITPQTCACVTVIFTATDNCGNSATTAANFCVTGSTPVITTPAANDTVACGEGAAGLFRAWLNNNGGATATSACGVTWSFGSPSLPSCCNSVTVVFTATDACGSTATTSATFSVGGGGSLTITQAANDTVTCSADINSAFAAWLANNGGATATGTGVNWSNNAGSSEITPQTCACVTVIFTATDQCGNSATTAANFCVTGSVPVITTPAANDTVACGEGAAGLFRAWLNNNGGASATSACGVTWSFGAPSLPSCCNSVTVVFTATDACGSTATTSATFVVGGGTLTITTPAQNDTVTCTSDISDEFTAWLNNNGGATGTGNGISWSNNAGSSEITPQTCGCVTVIFTAMDLCGNSATTAANFCVKSPAPLGVSIPANDTVNSCQNQAAVTAEYTTWLGLASATGGCSPRLSNSTGSPLACGGTVTIVFTASDACGNSATNSASFTVNAPAPVVFTCAKNDTVRSCQNQASVNSEFNTWLASATVSGGCSPSITNNSGPVTTCVTFQHGNTKALGSEISGYSGNVNINFDFTHFNSCFSEQWTVGGIPVEARALIEYNLSQIPVGSTILSANFSLYAADSLTDNGYANQPTYGTANASYLHQVTSAWNPSTVTWNNQPTASNSSEVLLPQSTNADESYLNLDVSGMVQQWVNNPSTNYGMLLKMIGSSYYNSMIFASSSYVDSSLWPKLTVCYTAPSTSGGNATAPSACGGTTSVTFNVTDSCGYTNSCSASFTVDAPAPVVFTCAKNDTVSGSLGQTAITAAFNTWLTTATVSGGCSPVLTNTGGTPSACPGGTTTVTFNVTDSCGYTNSCSANFVVTPTPPSVVCKNDTIQVLNDGTVVCIHPTDVLETASNCGPYTLALNDSCFSCSNIGNDTITLYMYDANGDVIDSCSPIVTINLKPSEVQCPSSHTVTLPLACGHATLGPPPVLAGNGCVKFSEIFTVGNFTCANIGINFDSLIIINPTTLDTLVCIDTVIVTDTVNIGAPGAPQSLTCPATPSFTAPTTDACNTLHSYSVKSDSTCPGSYTLTTYWYATDSCGVSSDTVSQPVRVTDNVAPTIGGQGPNATIQCTATPVFSGPTASDNCDPNPVIDSFDTRNPGTCPQAYSVTRNWYAIDACGNISDTVSQTINVIDNVAPTIGGQGANASITCGQNPVFTGPTASDNCDPNPTIDSFSSTSTVSCTTTYTRSWYAVDACGNISDTVSQVITQTCSSIQLGTPGNDTSISCAACLNGVLPGFTAPTLTDNCCTATLFSSMDTVLGACPQSYTVTKSWWATDLCGNKSDTVSQSVFVIDNTPPTIFGQGDDTTVSCSSVPPFWSPSAHDICDLNPTIHQSITTVPGNCPQSYTLVAKWWAIDACGNISDTVSQSINVVDTTAPILFGQGPNQFLGCNTCHVCEPGFTSPSTHDNCDLNPRISYVDDTIPGKCTGSYTITRTWTAKDACGNTSAPVSESITVGDTSAPTISGQGANATIQCTQTPVFTTPVAHDNCDKNPSIDSATVTTQGNCPQAYTVTRSWWAVDACGNHSDTVSQAISVIDNVAPTLTGVGMSKMIACNATPIFHAPTATDNCDPNPTLDSTTVKTNGSCAYSYTLTRYWWATDACGNRSDTLHQAIRIVDNTAPTISGQGPNATIQCTKIPAFSGPTASDMCDPNPTLDSFDVRKPGACPQAYSITRNWYAVDACGNISDTVSQTINVIDTARPVISGQGPNETIRCTQTPVFTAPTATAPCSTPVLDSTTTTIPGGCLQSYTLIRSWWAADACGNVSDTVSQTITVTDVAPTAICKLDTVTLNANGFATIVPSDVDGGSFDSCGSVMLSVSPDTFTCPSVGYVTVTLTVTDSCGSVSTCQTTVTVFPNTPVKAICPPDRSLTLDCGVATLNPEVLTVDTCTRAKIGISQSKFTCENIGVNTLVVSDTDIFGNITTCTWTVTVVDSVGIGTPGDDTTLVCNAVNSDRLPFTAPVIESCYTLNEYQTRTPGRCTYAYSITRYWYATDSCGTSSDTVSQTLNVIDTVKPTIIGQGASASVYCPAAPVFTAPTASANCGDATIFSYSDTVQGRCAADYTVSTYWYATDVCGNTSDTVSQTIVASDTTSPVLSGQGDDTTLTCLDCINGVPGFKAPTATDGCSPNPTIFSSRDSVPGACAQSYSIVMKWWAVDACGNVSDTVSQSVNVIDNTPPTIFGQGPDTTVSCSAVIPFINPSAHDVCDLNPTIDSMQVRIPGNCPESYTLITKWWAIDHCGNISDTVSQTINVIDTTAPVLSGQGANEFVSCPTCTICVPGFTAPSAHDVCDLNPRITFKDDTTAGKCTAAYSITRTWTASDACGNVSKPVSQTITVSDTIRPTVSGQGANATIQCTQTPVFTAPTAHDNCDATPSLDSATVTIQGNCPQSYRITRSWWAVDACGNVSDTVSQTINVTDNTRPTVSGQGANATIECTQTPVFTAPTATAACNATVNLDSNTVTTQGNCPQAYTEVRSWWAIDACGNISDTVSQTINVINNMRPTLSGVGMSKTISCSATPVFTAPKATASCDASVTLDSTTTTTTGACTYSYTVTRYWWAVDACGNISDTVHQAIRVVDNTAPTIGGQGANATIECTATPVFSGPTASDNCDPNPTIDSFDVRKAGNCPQSYSLTRNWYAVDACGNISDTVSQTINVIDNIRPTISGQGPNQSITCSATPAFTAPTATGSCDATTTLDSNTVTTQGACAYSYTVKRSWWAVDACGNYSDTVSQTISVTDNTRPTVTGQGDDTTISCVACINGVPGFLAPTAHDVCDPNPTLFVVRDSTPGACPQSYSITKKWWAVDACGNISDTVSQTVSVIDNTPPTLSGQGANETVSCDGNLSFTNPGVHDDCDLNPTVFAWDTTIQGNCPSSFTMIKKWWAIDHCGNISDTVSQTINVVDTKAPVLSGQGANEYVNCPSCTVCVPGFTSPSVTDACDLNPRVSYTDTTTPGVCSGAYIIKRTWTAIDACGNVSVPVSQTITVADTTAPVLTCPGDQTLSCGSTVTFGTPTATDNCDQTPTVAIVSSDTVTNGDGSITYTRNWSASDACGNSSTCSQVITTLACDQSTTRKDDAVDPNSGNSTGDDLAKLIAYPNPAHDYVTFSMTFSEDQQNVSLEMYNVTGQKIGNIFQGNVNAGQEYKVQFETSTLSSGTYYYRLSTASKSVVDKLTIVR